MPRVLTQAFFLVAIISGAFQIETDQNSMYVNSNNETKVWNDTIVVDWISQIFRPRPTTQPTTTTPMPVTTTRRPERCRRCTCGETNTLNRIVGGVETKVNEYPWMTLLMYRGRFYCGGAVINSRYVLTAAHCVDRFSKEFISIRILEHDRNYPGETETLDFTVKEVIPHEEYSNQNFDNDVALLKIDGYFSFDKKLRPVCLAERRKTYAGETGIVTGWGTTVVGGMSTDKLREVMVPIISNAECRATDYPAKKITDNMLCAGYKTGGKDSCQGDSGGPLHVKKGAIHSIAGVVSWGQDCAKPEFPGVYTRVNRYLSWINSRTRDACYC